MTRKTIFSTMLGILILLALSESQAMDAKTNKGPALTALLKNISMFFRGYDNQHIWETRWQDSTGWVDQGRVCNSAGTSCAFSNHTPAARIMTLPGADGKDQHWLFLFFSGHDNTDLWYKRRQIEVDDSGRVTYHDWEPAEVAATLQIKGSPGADAHRWINTPEPVPVVAYASVGRCPSGNVANDAALVVISADSLGTPSRWDVVSRIEELGRLTGPSVVSYDGDIYIFVTDKTSNRIWMLRSRTNDIRDPDWDIEIIPDSRSVAPPTAVVMDGRLFLAFHGHNNNYVWLRMFDGSSWQNIGYIDDRLSDQQPALTVAGEVDKSLILAFRPTHTEEICVGYIKLDDPLPSGSGSAHEWHTMRTDGVDCRPLPASYSCVQQGACGGSASSGCDCNAACVDSGTCCPDAAACNPSVPCHCPEGQSWFPDPLVDRSFHDPETQPKGDEWEDLMCSMDTSVIALPGGPDYGHFTLYSNPVNAKRVSCADGLNERMYYEDLERIGHILECAYAMYTNPVMSSASLVFHNPLDTTHTCQPQDPADPNDDQVPVWINSCGKGNGVNLLPRMYLDAQGGSISPDVDANALHEVGHMVFKSYNSYFNGGLVPLVNEGMPRIASIPASANFTPETPAIQPWATPPCSLEKYVNLSTVSLRDYEDCEAAAFWYGIFDLRGIKADHYEHHELIPACQEYLASLDPPMVDSVMYRMYGREIMLKFQERLSNCHPGGQADCAGDTPTCWERGRDPYSVYCAWEGIGELGCIPLEGSFNSHDADADLAGRGELFMAKAMEILDSVLRRDFGLGSDGIRFFAFREWLIQNYLNAAHVPPPVPSNPAFPNEFHLRSFGAHYHKIDVDAEGTQVRVVKRADMTNWAFAVFYKKASGEAEVIERWRRLSARTFYIPPSPDYTEVVLVVAALDDIADPERHSYVSEAVGHYRFWILE